MFMLCTEGLLADGNLSEEVTDCHGGAALGESFSKSLAAKIGMSGDS